MDLGMPLIALTNISAHSTHPEPVQAMVTSSRQLDPFVLAKTIGGKLHTTETLHHAQTRSTTRAPSNFPKGDCPPKGNPSSEIGAFVFTEIEKPPFHARSRQEVVEYSELPLDCRCE